MIGILIQSRLGSTRLPNKAMKPLGGATVLRQVIRRTIMADRGIIIVVSKDQLIIDVSNDEGVYYSKHDSEERDVLAEFYFAAKMFNLDTIVRITGDCPCVSPKEIGQMLDFFEEGTCDIICNHSDAIGGLGIDGTDIEVFSMDALKKARDGADDDFDKEHVTPWMYRNLKHSQVACMWDFDEKLSIDTQKDYELVCGIFDKLGNDFETRDIEKYFKEKRNEEV